MRVLRQRQTLGCVALLALAMQAVLAFAHTHSHATSLPRADSLAARAITYGMCRAGAEQPCAPVPHDDHGKCSLCWSMSHAAAGVIGAPPTASLPHCAEPMLSPARAAAPRQAWTSIQFQARAPPARAEA